jgi:serine/threonine-protein kinase RsbW
MGEQKTLTVASDLSSLEHVNAFAEMLKEWAPLEEGVYMNLMMALNEAACNAILHGNKLNPEKQVQIRATRFTDHLILEIHDQGEGFDPDSLPDPTHEDNLMKSGGRGIFIIRAYADHADFLDNGRLVKMRFQTKA